MSVLRILAFKTIFFGPFYYASASCRYIMLAFEKTFFRTFYYSTVVERIYWPVCNVYIARTII